MIARNSMKKKLPGRRMISRATFKVGFFSVCLAAAAGVMSQDQPAPKARLFDSYRGAEAEDLKARLDNLAIRVEEEPASRAFLVVYGPQGEGLGTGQHILKASADYLVNSRGLDESRLSTAYGGRYKDPREAWSELWLVPPGADPPELRDYRTDLRELRGKFAEYTEYDGILGCEGECSYNVNLAGFADALNEQPGSVAYIVVSNQVGAAIGTWRRVGKSTAADLESRGILAERIKLIFAGTRKVEKDEYPQQATVQLWILPKDAPPPVKESRSEGAPKEAVRLGTFWDNDLKYAATEKWVFEGFADVLKSNHNLGVCIILRPKEAPDFRDPEYPATSDQPPAPDLGKLIEKWKKQLVKDYQIEERRIFVITAAARDGYDGTIETWIIPPGANLPDPYADDSGDSDPPVDKPRGF